MMNHSLKNLCKLDVGTEITGKWHRNLYTIVKELGFGANGIVYLAEHNGQYVALKLSDNGMSITSEVNVLKSFAKVQGSALGPSLLDVDDWVRSKGTVSFYVMEYIHGQSFLTFIEQKGKSWISIMILQLLSDLDKLHTNGWVFGDLKPENLIVTGPAPKIRCIDVGGTTIQGRAIKEFTEFFDRGYWGLGSRKADPQYDLFAVAMIMINTAYPKQFPKTTGGIQQLKKMITEKQELSIYKNFLLYALQGHFSTAQEMRRYLLDLMGDGTKAPERNPKKSSSTINSGTTYTTSSQVRSRMVKTTHNQTKQSINRQTLKKKRKSYSLFETMLIVFVVTLLYAFYIIEKL
ncbi:protein kinase domain-containing protein [Pseudoneobacillus sp. C159]